MMKTPAKMAFNGPSQVGLSLPTRMGTESCLFEVKGTFYKVASVLASSFPLSKNYEDPRKKVWSLHFAPQPCTSSRR